MSQDGGRRGTRQGRAFRIPRSLQLPSAHPNATAARCRLCRNGTQHRLPVRRRWIDVAGTVWAAHAPSSRTWSFPPRPDTHHVRWIEPNRTRPARFSSQSKPARWSGRGTAVRRGSTARLVPHRYAHGSHAPIGTKSRLFGGGGWIFREHGRRRHLGASRRWPAASYLVGIAVDPADPNTVVVSAAQGPWAAYRPPNARPTSTVR